MPNVKTIDDLTAATAMADDLVFETIESGASAKVTGTQIAAWLEAHDLTFTGTLDFSGATVSGLDASGVAFTPAGGLSSTDVQAAIEELDDEAARIGDNETISGTWTFSNPISTPAGSAASPALRSSTYNTTGIFFTSATQIDLAFAGAQSIDFQVSGGWAWMDINATTGQAWTYLNSEIASAGVVGGLAIYGENSAAAAKAVAQLKGYWSDATASSEDSYTVLTAYSAGTQYDYLTFGSGHGAGTYSREFFFNSDVEIGYDLDVVGDLACYGGSFNMYGTSTEDVHFEIGLGRSGNGYSYFDLIGDPTYSDYGLRVIRNNGGANTGSSVVHRGTGALSLIAQEAGSIVFSTTNTTRLTINSGGSVNFVKGAYQSSGYSAGTKSSGTFTPDISNGNYQYATNGGAHSLAPPSTVGTIIVCYTNNGSAGTITFTGTFMGGDSLTTTNGNDFAIAVTNYGNGLSGANVFALQ